MVVDTSNLSSKCNRLLSHLMVTKISSRSNLVSPNTSSNLHLLSVMEGTNSQRQ